MVYCAATQTQQRALNKVHLISSTIRTLTVKTCQHAKKRTIEHDISICDDKAPFTVVVAQIGGNSAIWHLKDQVGQVSLALLCKQQGYMFTASMLLY